MDGEPEILHADNLNSIRAITDENGNLDKSASYKPFGEADETLHDLAAKPESKGFIGERYDMDSGLQFLNARYYDPALGMFIQPDWFEVTEPGVGTNRYSYSYNDPVNLRDPGGNIIESAWDGFNVGLGLASAGSNFYAGSYGAGLIDLGGVALDGLATAIPGIPGGASSGIKALRARKAAKRSQRSPCNSFAGHTLIETDAGLVPISEVTAGDLVWSKNDETGEVGYNPVTDTFNNLHRSHLVLVVDVNGASETIQVTKEHPVFVEEQGWVPAGNLQVGDVIETRNGDGARVRSLDTLQEALVAYNFEVANYHTYYATQSGLLVHNGLFGLDWGWGSGTGSKSKKSNSPADAERGGGDGRGQENGNPQNTTKKTNDPHARESKKEGERLLSKGADVHYNRSTDTALKQHGLNPIGGKEGRQQPDVLGVEIRSDGKGKIEVVEITSPSQKNKDQAEKAERIADKIRRSNPGVTVTSKAFPCG